ncbi:phospholipase/carboxylesterase [Catalinimonas alkaloidigena]|uniref:alpha/beta hydrolase n=1 Tax=Catalinimonas alkaloidigena TaxID=1075417 RepID=UPI00240682C5|nr:esterase [Catalinimonas alkaloidigena]MDF9797287.1 phospholipase/carboxylesterase [Catalinimonas alkaloidigena]
MPFSLKHIKRDPQIKSDKNPPMLVLLHGLGSNEQDLFSFAPLLDPKYLILSVQAPISYGFGGYAWFNIDLTSGIPSANIQQVMHARRQLHSFMNEAIATYQPDLDQIYLCGFSQGAIMSYATAFSEASRVRGIVAMSGYILREITPQLSFKPELRKLKIFATHGTGDQVLPIFLGRATNDYLRTLKLDYTYKEYDMAHEVNMDCFNDVKAWLAEQVN